MVSERAVLSATVWNEILQLLAGEAEPGDETRRVECLGDSRNVLFSTEFWCGWVLEFVFWRGWVFWSLFSEVIVKTFFCVFCVVFDTSKVFVQVTHTGNLWYLYVFVHFYHPNKRNIPDSKQCRNNPVRTGYSKAWNPSFEVSRGCYSCRM